MGGGGWTTKDWDSFQQTTTVGKSTAQVFTSRGMLDWMDPLNIEVRESRNSPDNPKATPIILGLDVSGTMGEIADYLARDGLGTLAQEILNRKPVSDPHIMAMGIGDAGEQFDAGYPYGGDQAPLQVTQFEADIRIAEQLKQIYLEGNGGGNGYESYTLAWYFAARKTDIDCVKDGRKGLLFTFGDERCPAVLAATNIQRVIGENPERNLSASDILAMVQQKYDVFHVVVEEGDYAKRDLRGVYESWKKVLPEGHVIPLKDKTKVAEVVVSVMEVWAGKDAALVAKSWDGSTGLVVAEATKGLVKGGGSNDNAPAVWRPGATGGARP